MARMSSSDIVHVQLSLHFQELRVEGLCVCMCVRGHVCVCVWVRG